MCSVQKAEVAVTRLRRRLVIWGSRRSRRVRRRAAGRRPGDQSARLAPTTGHVLLLSGPAAAQSSGRRSKNQSRPARSISQTSQTRGRPRQSCCQNGSPGGPGNRWHVERSIFRTHSSLLTLAMSTSCPNIRARSQALSARLLARRKNVPCGVISVGKSAQKRFEGAMPHDEKELRSDGKPQVEELPRFMVLRPAVSSRCSKTRCRRYNRAKSHLSALVIEV